MASGGYLGRGRYTLDLVGRPPGLATVLVALYVGDNEVDVDVRAVALRVRRGS